MTNSLSSTNGTVPEKWLQMREQRIRNHTDRLNGWLHLDFSNPEVIGDLQMIKDENSLVEFEKKLANWAALQNANFPASEVRFPLNKRGTVFNINAVPFQPRIMAPRFVLPIVPKSYKVGTPEAAPIFSRIHEKKKESIIRIEVTLADDECSSTLDEVTEEPSTTETRNAGHKDIDADSSSSCGRNRGDLTSQTSPDMAPLQLKTSNFPPCKRREYSSEKQSVDRPTEIDEVGFVPHVAKNNNKKSKTGKKKNKSGKKPKNDVVWPTSETIEQPNIDVDEVTEEPATTDTKKAGRENTDLDEKEQTGFDEVKSLSHEKAPNPEAIFKKITISVLSSGQASKKKTTKPPLTHVLPPDSAKLEKGTSSTLSSKLCEVLILKDNKVLVMPGSNGNNLIDATTTRLMQQKDVVGLAKTGFDEVESLPDEKTKNPKAIFEEDEFPVLSSVPAYEKKTIKSSTTHVLSLGSGKPESSKLCGHPLLNENKVPSVKEQNGNNTKTKTWASVVKSKSPIQPFSAKESQSGNRIKTQGSSVSSKPHPPSSSWKKTYKLGTGLCTITDIISIAVWIINSRAFPDTSTVHNPPKPKQFDNDGFEIVINGASTSEIASKMKRKIVIKKESPSSSTSSPSIPSSTEPSSATPSLSSSSSPQKKKKPSNQKKLKNVLKVTEDDRLAMELGIEENKKWQEKMKAEEEEKKTMENEEAEAQEGLLKKLKEDEEEKTPLKEENQETIPEEDKKEVTAEEMKEYREELSMRAAVQAFEEQCIGHKEHQMIIKKVKAFCASIKKLKGKKYSNPLVVPFDHREPKDVTNQRDIDNGHLLNIRISGAKKAGGTCNMFLAAVFGAFQEFYSTEVGPTLIKLFGRTDRETYMAREEHFIKTLFKDQAKILKFVGY
ncbi:hypothetical protein L3Y34_012824 [Caenorhabditis briggsae]|uniref:Uncharacterized protein n=1 Tax=Caenorhabditis briggsae TaxID=6238 RepID=A0AAE8ZTE1_CAEBR|nr:hypothetical protein L3Y34_012824 [Caenorhabditis briggsae]